MFFYLYIYVDRVRKTDKIHTRSQKLAHLHHVGSRELVLLSKGENQDSALETQGQYLHSDRSACLQTQSER